MQASGAPLVATEAAQGTAGGDSVIGPVFLPPGNDYNPDATAIVARFPSDRLVLYRLHIDGVARPVPIGDVPAPAAVGPHGLWGGDDWYYGVSIFPDYRPPDMGARGDASDGGASPTSPAPRRAGAPEATGLSLDAPFRGVYVRQGMLMLARQGSPQRCGPARNEACVRISDSFVATVYVPRARLVLVPQHQQTTPGQVRLGDYFSFSVTASPNTVDGMGVPRFVRTWEWIDEATGVATPITRCAGMTECPHIQMLAPGRVRVSGWANNTDTFAEYPLAPGLVGLALSGRAWIRAGDSTTYRASPQPAGAAVWDQHWRWTPITGGDGWELVHCRERDECRVTPAASGTISLLARVNGTLTVALRGVTVVPCPTGDSLVDDPEIRRWFRVALDSSLVTGPKELRVERRVYLYDSAGVTIGRMPAANTSPAPPNTLPRDGPCWNGADATPAAPGRLIAILHTHPFAPGETLPQTCNPASPLPVAYDAKTTGGLSDADWAFGSGPPSTPPMLVVDTRTVYRGNPMPPVYGVYFKQLFDKATGQLKDVVMPGAWKSFQHQWQRNSVTPACSVF